MKKLILAIPCLLLLLSACQETKNKTSTLEKSVEAISGQKIDMADADNIEKNEAIVNITLGTDRCRFFCGIFFKN